MVIHISDHIHEWRHRHRLIRVEIPHAFLAYLFTKSLFPKISLGDSMLAMVIEEQLVLCA